MAATNWIDRVYPIGAKVMTPDGIGWVENHTCEGGFKGTTTTGIMVELDTGKHVGFSDMGVMGGTERFFGIRK